MSNIETSIKKFVPPHDHLTAFANARMEIQEAGLSKDGKNPHFGNTYTTLNKIITVCEPILLKHGLVTTFTQTYDKETIHGSKESTVFFRMRITHVETREYFETFVTMFSERKPQPIGSVMTYAKRFLYQNLLMIVGDDDDDANVAQQSVNRL
tara:strand:+ start:867 stop:1325 length:459 start_codon:yes stop_codon:yes gene_type:complete